LICRVCDTAVLDVAVVHEAADALFVATSDLLFVFMRQQGTPQTMTGQVLLATGSKKQRQTDIQTDR